MAFLGKGDVVQLNAKHRWCGCLGIIEYIDADRALVCVPVPHQDKAYIFAKNDEIELIGHEEVTERGNEDDE